MLPASVENAISILETAEDAPLTREILVAFCVLEALKHHFPSLVQDKVRRARKAEAVKALRCRYKLSGRGSEEDSIKASAVMNPSPQQSSQQQSVAA